MANPREKRTYTSPQRQEQARATRLKMLEAARRLFVANGYVTTTLPAIAREAGVSAATVTATFRTKLGVFEALSVWSVRDDEIARPLAEQPWWREMLDELDPARQLARHASNVRRIHDRTTDLFEIARSAAGAEPEVAALRRRLGEAHLSDDRQVAQSLAQKGALGPGVTPEQATDLLWALGSADLYRLLVVDRVWPREQYEQWLASAWIHALLNPRIDHTT